MWISAAPVGARLSRRPLPSVREAASSCRLPPQPSGDPYGRLELRARAAAGVEGAVACDGAGLGGGESHRQPAIPGPVVRTNFESSVHSVPSRHLSATGLARKAAAKAHGNFLGSPSQPDSVHVRLHSVVDQLQSFLWPSLRVALALWPDAGEGAHRKRGRPDRSFWERPLVIGRRRTVPGATAAGHSGTRPGSRLADAVACFIFISNARVSNQPVLQTARSRVRRRFPECLRRSPHGRAAEAA